MTDLDKLEKMTKNILDNKKEDSCTLPEDEICHTSKDCHSCLAKRIVQLFEEYISLKLETMEIVKPPENVGPDFIYGTHKQINYDIKHIRGKK